MNTRSSMRTAVLLDDPAKKDTTAKNSRTSSITRNEECDEKYTYSRELKTPKKQKKVNSIEESNISVTPTKQKKTEENSEPHIIESDKSSYTPSSLFKILALNSPEKSRKKLFNNLIDLEIFKSNIYQDAVKVLHSNLPSDMPGREKEIKEITAFVNEQMNNNCSGSLYISGPPGTGKTAVVHYVLQNSIGTNFKYMYINCTSVKSPAAIYSKILEEFGVKNIAEKDHLKEFEKILKNNQQTIVLVLDEVDHLGTKHQSILYTIFEWPSRPNYNLILIGIANTLDLIDRILPRLLARCELKPQLMHFAPYTKQQIIDILKSRLKSADVLNVFSPAALQMLAGKVAAGSGDIRSALDIGRAVVKLVDQNQYVDALQPIENLDLVNKETTAVSLKDILTVINKVYGRSEDSLEENDSMPLQQKIILCSLVLIKTKGKNKEVTIGKLHEVYRKICIKRNLLVMDEAEFVGLCYLIESRGIIKVNRRKEPRLQKVDLVWDDQEIATALKDKVLLSTILQDDTCLGKM